MVLLASPVVGARPVDDGHPGGRLPSPADFDALRDTLVGADLRQLADSIHRRSGRARTCRVDERRAATCRCFVFDDDEWRLGAARAEWRRGEADRWRRLVAANANLALSARRLRVVDDRIEARDATLILADASTVTVGRLVVEPEAVRLEDVAWSRQSIDLESRFASPCSSQDVSSSRPSFLTADSAEWTPDTGWSFQRLRTRSPKLPLGAGEMERPSRASGMLPPSLAAAPGGIGGFFRVLEGRSGLGAGADVVPTEWYGLGPTLATEARSSRHAFRRAAPSLLDVRLTLDRQTESLGYYAVGDFRRGGPRTHVDLHAESASRPGYWNLLRLNGDRMPRDWRDSRGGVALAGEDYALNLAVGRTVDDTDLREPTGFGATTTGRLNFGVDRPVAEHVTLESNVTHRSAFRRRSPNLHGSLLYGGLRGDWTPLRGVDVMVEVGGRMASHLADQETVGDSGGSAIDAVTAAQLLVRTGLGVRVDGRFGEWHHRIRPRLDLYGEIGGAGPARDSLWTDSPNWTRAPATRIPGWTALTGAVEQDWRSSNGTELSIPLGVFWNGGGFGPAWRGGPKPFGRAAFSHRALRVEGGAMVDPSAEQSDLRPWGSLDVHGESVVAGLQTTSLAPGNQAVALLDGASGGLSQVSHVLQTRLAQQSASGWWHRAYVEWRLPRVATRIACMARRNLGRWALTAGATRQLPALGWGLSLDGVVAERFERWGIVLGVRPVEPG